MGPPAPAPIALTGPSPSAGLMMLAKDARWGATKNAHVAAAKNTRSAMAARHLKATHICLAEPGDVEILIDLSLRTIRASYKSFLGEAAVEAFISSGAVAGFVRLTADSGLVETLDCQVVGHAVGADGHIDLMMVDVHHHHQGLGTQLLSHLEKELFRGPDALVLESFRDNDQANAFYRKHGWELTGAYRDQEHGLEMITMRKKALR